MKSRKQRSSRFGLRRSAEFRLRALGALVALCGVAATIPGSAYSGGISLNATGVSACTASGCHSGGVTPAVSIGSAPTWMEAGTSDAMYVRVNNLSSGQQYYGFNAWPSSGSLSTNGDTSVSVINTNEVTHSARQGPAGFWDFDFDFDAPSTSGTVTITAHGNNVDMDFWTTGDRSNSASVSIAICTDGDNDNNYAGPANCPGTSDCDDGDGDNYYGNTEVCDGEDNDCDGSTDEGVTTTYYRDFDNDNRGNPSNTIQACSQPAGYVTNANDCDDNDPNNYTGNTEVCDGQDNDCDTSVDEGVQTTYYRDADVDTYGNPSVTTQACSAPAGFVANSSDCNDSCNSCRPGGTEVCDGEDNDCDTSVDESSAVDASTWYRDFDVDTYGNPSNSTVACNQPAGYVANNTDCDDGDNQRFPGNGEICDDKDNDCNGATPVDDGCDDDNDNHCDIAMTTVGTPSTCTAGSSDCDDDDNQRYPGLSERCDNKDNDCNGATAVDVGCDDDNDDFCDSGMTVVGTPAVCPEGGGDCDDDCANCNPDEDEVCDGNDNDCNGPVDDNLTAITCGLGICEQTAASCSGGVPQSCTPLPAGTESCANQGTDDDCDGNDAELENNIFEGQAGCDSGLPGICGPGTYTCDGSSLGCNEIITAGAQDEICDGLDNDCDGATDEGCDDDNDDYCDITMTVVGTPPTCSEGGGDCNDAAGGADIYPGAPETCSNLAVDNDCDGFDTELSGEVGPDTPCTSSSPGICAPGIQTCLGATLTCVPSIAPGSQPEVCNNLDDDCDGLTDNGLPNLECGVGECFNSVPACVGGLDNVCVENPSASERCDDADNDCDGMTDEGCDDDNDNYCDINIPTEGNPSTCTAGGGDCDDDALQSYPGAGELCDVEDNDCDGDVDEVEDIALAVCGQGICERTGTTCDPASCTPGDPETEICDNLDNDCDGDVDEGCDDDDDDYCDDDMVTVGAPTICPLGPGDCADDIAEDNPDGIETCDNLDNDCDGEADEIADVPLAVCGQGICERTGTTCFAESCTPGAPLQEICDGLDNDCNGLPDDGIPLATCGEGACQTQGTSCLPSSCVPLPVDDDHLEICDGVDDDCNGEVDNGCDDDGDGYCDSNHTLVSSPFCPFGGDDCNDDNPDTHPDAVEICDDEDNDCEGCAVATDCVDNGMVEVVCGRGECRAEGTMCIDGVADDCVPGEPEPEVCDGLDNDCDGLIDNGIGDITCGVGECMVIVPGCASGAEGECTPREGSDEICDGLDNDCDGRADEDPETLCEDGLCVAGVCVPNELIEDVENGEVDVRDITDERFLLENTAGASQGGAATLPEVVEFEGGGIPDEEGGCSTRGVGNSSGSKPLLLVLFTLGFWAIRRRRVA